MRGAGKLAVAVLLVGTVAGCSSGGTPQTQPTQDNDPNILVGCGPLTDHNIADQLGAGSVRQQSAPTICSWTAQTPGGTVDVSYSWFKDDVLMRETQVAAQYGYRIDKTVVKKFGGMYWHDPQDPGSCGVTAFDSGTVTWWVQSRDHAVQPDPCATAMKLMQMTLTLDGL